jgi:hypothetical protein
MTIFGAREACRAAEEQTRDIAGSNAISRRLIWHPQQAPELGVVALNVRTQRTTTIRQYARFVSGRNSCFVLILVALPPPEVGQENACSGLAR